MIYLNESNINYGTKVELDLIEEDNPVFKKRLSEFKNLYKYNEKLNLEFYKELVSLCRVSSNRLYIHEYLYNDTSVKMYIRHASRIYRVRYNLVSELITKFLPYNNGDLKRLKKRLDNGYTPVITKISENAGSIKIGLPKRK